MQIGLMYINKSYYKDTFCKMTREEQKKYMTRGDYARMDAKTLELKLNEALKNIPHASKRNKTKATKTHTSSDRGRNESDNNNGQGTTEVKKE